jgi:hypothetical protein
MMVSRLIDPLGSPFGHLATDCLEEDGAKETYDLSTERKRKRKKRKEEGDETKFCQRSA